ncbi:polysaccharide deacetylase family protein [Candidatus Poriferisodalis sp.]|uniref:polysaccharide deacetylase family protein n=1 Tax=Candidatus Poriferisodalis sp. TaxID=3101277 RepID=UPI003B01BCB0
MRKRGASGLVRLLILTAVLSGACQVQQSPDAAPVASESSVAGQTEVSTGATSAAVPSPTLPPPAPSASDEPTSDEPTSSDPGLPDGPEAVDDGIDDQPTAQEAHEPDVVEADPVEPEPLPADLEAALRTSFPDAAYVLHPEVGRGDLNGDGVDDFAVYVEARFADLPEGNLLVPVIDTGADFDVQPPVELGRHIIIDTTDIRDGAVEVSFFDRSPGEPLTVITRRTTLSISPDSAGASDAAPAWIATAIRVEPIANVQALQINRPATQVTFELDGIGTVMPDRIELRERHRYVVHAAEQDVIVVTLTAPAGVWLEAGLGDDAMLVPIAEQTQRFATYVPASGAWTVTVASTLPEPADYRLSIDVFPAALGAGIATRDPTGFWSSTHASPPALPDDGPVVYLTFDDGPHPTYTPQVLDVLARHGARATFFVVGYLAERYPLLIQRIAHEGHTLANHSWQHESLARVSKAAFDRSVGRTQETLGPLATPCLRPPYYAIGRFTEEWSNELGLRLVGWSYSPRDWEQRPAQAIANGLVARSYPGAIILLHDGGGPRSATVRGLDMALERLSDRGFEFKPLCR